MLVGSVVQNESYSDQKVRLALPLQVAYATDLERAMAILVEAALSFLGLGVQPPEPSWGSMLAFGRSLLGQAPWYATFSGLAIFVTVLALNFLGDGLREALDPRLRSVERGA